MMKYYYYKLIDIILFWWYAIQSQILKKKISIFDDHFIKCAIYDINTKKYSTIYDYTNLLWYYYNKFIHGVDLININQHLDNDISNLNNSSVLIGTYFNDDIEHSIILMNNNFKNIKMIDTTTVILYVILNDKYDITHEFDIFNKSLLFNKLLSCNDIVYIFSKFMNKHYYENNNVIKLSTDKDYIEISFKNNEIIKLK